MLETERELYKLGVPVKHVITKSRRLSTNWPPFSRTPIVATDHQQMIMLTLQRVAQKYGMACLLHEKPFAGIQRLGQARQLVDGLLGGQTCSSRGDNPHENAQFPGLLRRGDSGGALELGSAARDRGL